MSTAPVTTDSMRHFADSCLGWASVAQNASHHQTMMSQAQQWTAIAEAIDRITDADRAFLVDDLRAKLN